MACEYLGIQTLSVSLEEANSEARFNFEDRPRLHACTFKAEMYIRSWFDLFDGLDLPLPQDF